MLNVTWSLRMATLVSSLFVCFWFPQSALSKVQIIAGSDITGDEKTVNEIVAAFDRAEAAIHARDIDTVMSLYSKRHDYHKLRKSDARRLWVEIFEHYQKLFSTHLFTEIKTSGSESELSAEIKCTGALWGLSNETGQKVTVDSWFEEVHYLVKEDRVW